MSAEYDMILRFLRNNLDDSGFEEFSNALDEAIAAAVLRERERCLSHAQSIVDFYGDADTGMHPLQVRERDCAAQIAAAIKEHLK